MIFCGYISISDESGRVKRQKFILQGVTVIITAIAVQFDEKYFDESPTENNDSLRGQIFKRLFGGSSDICYQKLWLKKYSFFKSCGILREKRGWVTWDI